MRAFAPVFRFGPAIVVMGVIFLASATPGHDLPKFGLVDLLAKKGGHVVGYGLLGLSYLHALAPWAPASARAACIAVLLATLYGVGDELHQRFVPGRGPGGLDVLIDAGGATLAVGLRLWRQARREAARAVPQA